MGVNLKEMGDGAAEFRSLTHRAGKCCLGMVIGDLHESYFKRLGFEVERNEFSFKKQRKGRSDDQEA